MTHDWLLKDSGEGRYEVEHHRRVMLGGADLDYAKDYIRRVKLPDEKVFLVESDGYRTEITHEFRRRRSVR